MTNEELARAWNQHEFCPECKSKEIETVRIQVKKAFSSRFENKYICKSCGCQWFTNEKDERGFA